MFNLTKEFFEMKINSSKITTVNCNWNSGAAESPWSSFSAFTTRGAWYTSPRTKVYIFESSQVLQDLDQAQ